MKALDSPNPNPEERFTLKEKIFYTLGGIAVLGGTFLVGRSIVRKVISNKEEKSTLDEGSVAAYAKQIKMAFENDNWPGTNTKELRRIMVEIPSKVDTAKVANSYNRLYNRSMYGDMKSELQSTEYNEMLSIVAAKPKRSGKRARPVNLSVKYPEWAKRLKAAFDKSYGIFPGTDEDAIRSVFIEIPTQAAYVEVGKAYAKIYGRNMSDDLKGELEFWEYGDYMKMITAKPLS